MYTKSSECRLQREEIDEDGERDGDLEREEKQRRARKGRELKVSKERQDALLNLLKDKHSILIS